MRHWNMESIYDYGARAGFWRLHRLFTERDIPLTIYGVTTALARNPEQVAAMKAAGWEIASHGLKWVDHRDMPPEEEAAQIAESFRLHTEVVGEPPQGWYTGRCSMNTVRLTAETRKLAWISDTYDDDLPYWREYGDHDQLVIPYTLEANDMRFATAPGYITGEQFFTYLKDSFDTLYEEGQRRPRQDVFHRAAQPPDRPSGQDGGAEAVSRLCTIASRRLVPPPHRHCRALGENPSAPAASSGPSQMSRDRFVERFGCIFEHSPWIADRAFELELGPAHDCASGPAQRAVPACSAVPRPTERMGVLTAHPDLAGKLAAAKRLTAESTHEQASAALDALTDDERATFQQLNADYVAKHGFPFIIAVRDNTKDSILAAFHDPHRQ